MLLLLLLAQHFPRPQLLMHGLGAHQAKGAAAAAAASKTSAAVCLMLCLLAGPEPHIAGRHVDIIKQLHHGAVHRHTRCDDLNSTRQRRLLCLPCRQTHAAPPQVDTSVSSSKTGSIQSC